MLKHSVSIFVHNTGHTESHDNCLCYLSSAVLSLSERADTELLAQAATSRRTILMNMDFEIVLFLYCL